jgi:hypothetical protein
LQPVEPGAGAYRLWWTSAMARLGLVVVSGLAIAAVAATAAQAES